MKKILIVCAPMMLGLIWVFVYGAVLVKAQDNDKPTVVHGYDYGDRLSRADQVRIMQECIDDTRSLHIFHDKWITGDRKTARRLDSVEQVKVATLFFQYRTGMMLPIQQR